MKNNNLSKSVEATMNAFEEKVKSLNVSKPTEDKLASLAAHIDKQVEIPLEYIKIEDNVRRSIDTSSIKFAELVQSIKTQGLLQNLVVDLRFENDFHELYCIAGQRRLLAAREAGKLKANCLIKQFANAGDRIASGLAENLTREDLHCVDVAEGFAGLIANGWSHDQIAEHFERNPRTIRRYLTIAAWPSEVLSIIRDNQEIFTTKLLFNELIAHKYESEDELIKIVKSKVQHRKADNKGNRARNVQSIKILERELSEKVKLKLTVKGNEEIGKITIPYRTSLELEQLRKFLLGVEV